MTEFTENRRREHAAQCKQCKSGQSYHNLFESHIISEIVVQIFFKFIHTFPIDNPP